MPQTPTPSPVQAPEREEIVYDLSDMGPWREIEVILHNDDNHSMDEVVVQLIKALRCSVGRAHAIMMEAHSNGRATVIVAKREKAEKVAAILREIDLKVTLRQIN